MKRPNKKIATALVFVFIIALGYYLFLNTKNQTAKPIQNSRSIFGGNQSTPTPFPFKEITIPYLREKTYEGRLGELNNSYDTQNYIAYLTSYNSEGFQINGLLTRPKGNMPQGGWPAVVFIHGYIPPAQYQTSQQYYDYVDYLAKNGLVVFKIDLRGHGESEGEPSGAYYSQDYIVDTLNAYAALQNADFVNEEKIGLWGHSMAGNVVMRSFAVKPEIPAVVIWAGAVYSYVDWREYGINDDSYQPPNMNSQRVRRRQQLINTYGEPSESSEFWKLVAPTNFLHELKGAIQIHHAINDNVVDIEYSRNLISLLNKTTVPHQLHEYSDGGHNISGNSYIEAMQKTVEFYKRNL